MKKKELKQLEERLVRMRERALKELANYDESFASSLQASDGDLSAYSFHMADQGTDAMEREKAFLFASKEGRYLYHLDEALRRLYRTPERFDVCEECGDKISGKRLEARPETTLCIRCKEEQEREEQQPAYSELAGLRLLHDCSEVPGSSPSGAETGEAEQPVGA